MLPASEYEYAGQSLHVAADGAAEAVLYFPAGQMLQVVDTVRATLPHSQLKHTASAADVALLIPYVPAAQGGPSHAVAPDAFWYVPGVHSLHSVVTPQI